MDTNYFTILHHFFFFELLLLNCFHSFALHIFIKDILQVSYVFSHSYIFAFEKSGNITLPEYIQKNHLHISNWIIIAFSCPVILDCNGVCAYIQFGIFCFFLFYEVFALVWKDWWEFYAGWVNIYRLNWTPYYTLATYTRSDSI